MAPTSRIYLTRHAQAEHNVEDDYSIPDAPLTDLGKRQAARLPGLTPELQQTAQVILSSPLRRTLQTVSLGFADAVDRLGGHTEVVCLPQLQAREVLEAHPEFARFDLSNLTPEWTSKQGFYAADHDSLNARAKWIRQYLLERPEEHIVLVAHGDILRRVIQEEYPWTNAEVRLFQFVPDKVDSNDPVLFHVADIAAGGRTDADLDTAAGGQGAYPTNSAPTLPGPSNPGSSLSAGGKETESSLASIEERVKQIQASVESQANELEDLDRRLAEAEAKKAQLESNV
ncbi:hypothetical protein MBRA1_001215 [Malassezia brasiliensis]|uniref:Phosphoglycerate mutase-like protein n=1 Tax=Malassezia brasiliensis TaxID=1821822 RepID=A0AAF0DSF1_9BASI|nr:hypothetical protein MBRA1_001215 [Malassezia brasiliensis]